MLRKTFYGALAALLAFALAAPVTAQDEDLTADDIIAMNLEAKGGAEKIAAMDTARVTGSMLMGPEMSAPFTLEWKRPDKVRLEFTFQGQTAVQAYDGETAWMHMPFLGQAAPEEMPEEARKQVTDMADFEGPLVGYKEKGHTVEYLGVEDAEGTPAYKLRVTKKNGDVVDLFLDKDAHLEIMGTGKTEVNGQPIEVVSTFGDYKEVGDGLIMAHSMEIRPAGAPAGQVITMETIEVNVDLPDDRFTMPEAPAEEAETETPGE